MLKIVTHLPQLPVLAMLLFMVAVDCNLFDIMGYAMKTAPSRFSTTTDSKNALTKSATTPSVFHSLTRETGPSASNVSTSTQILTECSSADRTVWQTRSLITWMDVSSSVLKLKLKCLSIISWQTSCSMRLTIRYAMELLRTREGQREHATQLETVES